MPPPRPRARRSCRTRPRRPGCARRRRHRGSCRAPQTPSMQFPVNLSGVHAVSSSDRCGPTWPRKSSGQVKRRAGIRGGCRRVGRVVGRRGGRIGPAWRSVWGNGRRQAWIHRCMIAFIRGIWRVPKLPASETPVAKRKVMPICCGHDVLWELVLIVWLSAFAAFDRLHGGTTPVR